MAKRFERLAKVATIYAVIFGVSLGLCGATFVFGNVMADGGSAAMSFGILELFGIAIGLLGLIVTGLMAVFQMIFPEKDERP